MFHCKPCFPDLFLTRVFEGQHVAIIVKKSYLPNQINFINNYTIYINRDQHPWHSFTYNPLKQDWSHSSQVLISCHYSEVAPWHTKFSFATPCNTHHIVIGKMGELEGEAG